MRFPAALLVLLLASGCAEPENNARSNADEDQLPAVVDRTQAELPARPVRVGFDGPMFDACASFGEVTNLSSSGGNVLSVRSAPAESAVEIDRLGPGVGVSMCQKVGDWIGIVYAPQNAGTGEGEPIDCGTGSPVPTAREYDGPCRSGWVDENYIKLVAG